MSASWLQRLSQRIGRPMAWLSGAPAQSVRVDKGQYAYPRRLLIYQDSKFFAASVSYVKLFALFPCLLVTWNISWPEWQAANNAMAKARAAARSITCLLAVPAVSFFTNPYTFAIFLLLPPAARRSPKALKTWLTKIPPSTQVEFQTLGWFVGAPVNRTHTIENLRTLPPRIGRIANFSTTDARRKLVASEKHFYVRKGAGAGEETVKWKTIWPNVAKTIRGQSQWN